MPAQLTYPGVYIEELSSGVRTITGVATSITAFVGWAPKGPTKGAMRILSFSDFRRVFGDIHPASYLGYGVQHFFDNGGSDAYVLRLTDGTDAAGACESGGLKIRASSPGTWSTFYGVRVKMRNDGRFLLAVVLFARNTDGTPDTTKFQDVEVFPNLSADKNDPRFVMEIIDDEKRGSHLIEIADVGTIANSDPVQIQGGTDSPPTDLDAINNAPWPGLVVKAAEENGPLDKIDLFNLLCVPGFATATTELGKLTQFCQRRRAFLIADSERTSGADKYPDGPPVKGIKKNGSFYFPWIKAPDSLSEGRITDFPPSGFMAGLYARTDASRGVWKAPAGTEATLVGTVGPSVGLTDKENGVLNVKAVNCIRSFPVYGTVAWGARTLDGDDEVGSEWKYIPVRRTALFIEESLYRGTQWAVFEPNDEPLWAQLRLNIGAFMHDLFRQGAFQGRTPREAYFVKCDKETTTQSDINRGVVNVIVGFAPLKPAEFVVIKLQQIAGQLEA